MIPAAGQPSLLGVALALALLPGAAASQESLAGDWSPKGTDTGDPKFAAVDCAPMDQDCQEEHSNFVTDVYLRIVQDETTGAMTMTSSGPLSASLDAPAGEEDVFNLSMASGGRATLHLRSAACAGQKDCFEIAGTTDPTALSDGVYVPVVPKLADGTLTMSIKDRFGSVPANMDLAGHCYDITKMGLDKFTVSQGCQQQIFQKFGEMDPDDYVVASEGDEKMVAIPYGWKYLPIGLTYGANNARILESASDMMDSHQRTIGTNVSLGLGVSFGESQNTTRKQLTDDMYERSLTFSEFHYITAAFALVVDKPNARLAPPFYEAITDAAKAAEPDFQAVIAEFGTHYAYATTMGERGKLVSAITEENLVKLHNEGVDISSSTSVGMTVPIGALGKAKASGDASQGTADELDLKMAATLGTDYGNYVCEGGLNCNGTNPSGGVSVPVLLDLRPLSDLLAPPFFAEIDDLPALRVAFAQAITEYAFGGDPVSRDAAARFVRISGAQDNCDQWSEGIYTRVCATTEMTVVGPTTFMAVAEGNGMRPTAPNASSIVLPANDGATVTVSTMVSLDGGWCSYNGPDESIFMPLGGGQRLGIETGSASLPEDINDLAALNWQLRVDLSDTVCGENYYSNIPLWVHLQIEPVSAAQVLIH